MIGAIDILKARILIVDDLAANVAVLEQMLQGAGYISVWSTRDPRQVDALQRSEPFDLILLDLQMPGMDGFQVMDQLKKTDPHGGPPVVVITAQPDHKLRALKAGARDFVSKPFDLAEVLMRVHNVIEVSLLHRNERLLGKSRLEKSQRIAGLGDWEYDAEHQHLRWSDEVYRILGIAREDFPPEAATFYRQVHPDDLAMVHLQKQAAKESSRRVEFEHRIIRPGGEVRHIHQITETIVDGHGQPIRESGTLQDITERKAADETLRQSEERHRKLLMFSPDATFVHVEGVITLVNRAFCQLMGTNEPDALIGRSALEVPHADYQSLVRSRMQRILNNQYVAPSEMKFVRLDGSLVDVEVASVAFVLRGRQEMQVVARDITARKAAEAALRESEERFKFVARAVSDVVWDWNLPANRLWWSEGFRTTFGFATMELEPGIESWSTRIHFEERDRVIASLHAAIDTGAESWAAEYRFRCQNGSHALVQDRGYILRDAAGVAVRMVGGMRDLTEQKKLEAQYLRAQRMEGIGTLAGGIAHDLNNMLAPIMMSIELLKLDSAGDARRLKILDIIYRSSRRGAELVRQVLAFARGVDGERIAIRMRRLLDDLDGIISETFPRNIRITTAVAADLASFMGDPTQLHQVLLNLAVNARDAMPHGGSLTLMARNITLDAQYAGTSPEAKAGTYVLLEVTDTGQGIPSELRERIFEPFFTTKEVGKGTGLGLATVHTIIKSHGGFLEVESEVGQGTTFKVYLPADAALVTAATAHPFDADLPRGRNEIVLVVDDESSIREITRQTLEAFGYQVLTASDGAEAVALYAQQPKQIAVVITDMMMPVMDGAAVIQVLQRINPAIRLIAASGVESGNQLGKATSSGVQDILPKPYTAETLLKLLRKVLDQPVVIGPG